MSGSQLVTLMTGVLTVGGIESTNQLYDCVAVLPARSAAVTTMVWLPSLATVAWYGLVHGEPGGATFTAHDVMPPVTVNPNDVVRLLFGLVPPVMVLSTGGTVSI